MDDGDDDDNADAATSAATISELCASEPGSAPSVVSFKDQKLQRLADQIKSKVTEKKKDKEPTESKPQIESLGEELKALVEKAKAAAQQKKDASKEVTKNNHHLPDHATCLILLPSPIN